MRKRKWRLRKVRSSISVPTHFNSPLNISIRSGADEEDEGAEVEDAEDAESDGEEVSDFIDLLVVANPMADLLSMMSRPPRQRKSVSRVRPLKQRRATMFLRRLGPKTPKLKSDIESLNRSLKLLCLCCPPCSIPKVGQDSEPLAAAGKGGFSTLYHRSLVTSIVLGV